MIPVGRSRKKLLKQDLIEAADKFKE